MVSRSRSRFLRPSDEDEDSILDDGRAELISELREYAADADDEFNKEELLAITYRLPPTPTPTLSVPPPEPPLPAPSVRRVAARKKK